MHDFIKHLQEYRIQSLAVILIIGVTSDLTPSGMSSCKEK
jgi:hypothetical protein